MNLINLLNGIPIVSTTGNLEIEISEIAQDSRKSCPGCLFVATVGTAVDGHKYIDSAIEKGAVAIVCQNLPENLTDGVTYIKCTDSSETLGLIATKWNGDPSKRMKVVGVTGTNGKTTIATLLYKVFNKMGYKSGLLSTVCNYIGDEAIPATHTTPDPIQLNSLLGRMADEGCEYAFMEVSSHAADQKRIAGIKFAGGIFTNITRDHLDYHKTFANYINAKRSFFESLDADAFALTNVDDKNGLVITQTTKAKVYTYSVREEANFRSRLIEDTIDGMQLETEGIEWYAQFVGKFNVSNLTAIFGACRLLGVEERDVVTVLSSLAPVCGRFEVIRSEKGAAAIVDYAHTPDALQNVIDTARDVMYGKGRLITVCGCGGDRDKGKRPIMAKISVENSDLTILTSDNPRSEDPADILNDMVVGVNDEYINKFLVNADREQAIKTALMIANPNDIVLVAGKGHETYQEIKGVKHHFDDHEVIKKYI